jgi:hypothetical protein
LIVFSLVIELEISSKMRLSKYYEKKEVLQSTSSLRYILRLNILMLSASISNNTRVSIPRDTEESIFNASRRGSIDDSSSNIFLSISESIKLIITLR